MKLAYQQLEQHAAKTLAPIYLISSDETLLLQEAIFFLRTSAQKKGFTERVKIGVDDADWGEHLYAGAHELSLFAERRVLELDLRGVKLNQTNSGMLQTYAEKPAENTVLLISCHKLDAKTEQSRWYKALEKHGVVVTIWPVTAEQLPQWIMQRAKKAELSLSPAAATWLAQRVEGNLLAAAQEIEKLVLLQPQGTLDEKMLADMIVDHTHFDVYQLVDSVLLGNSKRALHILENLMAEDTEPTLINWALTRELTTLADIHRQMKQGVALSALFSQLRIWDKRQPGVRAFLQRWTLQDCWDLLLQASRIDRVIKGVEAGSLQNALVGLIMNMSCHKSAQLK